MKDSDSRPMKVSRIIKVSDSSNCPFLDVEYWECKIIASGRARERACGGGLFKKFPKKCPLNKFDEVIVRS